MEPGKELLDRIAHDSLRQISDLGKGSQWRLKHKGIVDRNDQPGIMAAIDPIQTIARSLENHGR
jgi:hypothetical protein